MQHFMTDLHKIMICICEVRENQHRKGHTFSTKVSWGYI